jgi:hypothetical protein
MRKVPIFFGSLISLVCLFGCSKESSHLSQSIQSPISVLDTLRLEQEFRQWSDSVFASIKEKPPIHIRIQKYSNNRVWFVDGVYHLFEITANEEGSNWRSEVPRLIAVVTTSAGDTAVLYDSGFFVPECGAEPERSFGGVTFLRIAGKPLVEFNVETRPIRCMDIDGGTTVEAHFCLASKPYPEVLSIQKSMLEFEHPNKRSVTEIIPNGCVDGDCAYLMIWTFGPSTEYRTYIWNADSTRLVATK